MEMLIACSWNISRDFLDLKTLQNMSIVPLTSGCSTV